MKRLLSAAAGVALLASPAASEPTGDFQAAAISFATARAICMGYKVPDDFYGMVIALAASEMKMELPEAMLAIAAKSVIFEENLKAPGAVRTFCDDMKRLTPKK